MIQLNIFDFFWFDRNELLDKITSLGVNEEKKLLLDGNDFIVRKNEVGLYELISDQSEQAFRKAEKCCNAIINITIN